MGQISKIIAGMGLLIGMYLVISNGTNSAKIISTLASSSTSVIKGLQGR